MHFGERNTFRGVVLGPNVSHFTDFLRSGRMIGIKAFRPEIRAYGAVSLVYFQFEETLEVYSKVIRSPGQAVYLFKSAPPVTLLACTETATVISNIGDPYPVER